MEDGIKIVFLPCHNIYPKGKQKIWTMVFLDNTFEGTLSSISGLNMFFIGIEGGNWNLGWFQKT